MNRVFKMTLKTLIIKFSTMGVRVSPEQRMMALNILEHSVKCMAQAMMRK